MILEYFQEINNIPRNSWKEKWIRDFLISWAKKKKLEYKTDKKWNLVVYVPATKGRDLDETIILQSHMDMVCVKRETSNHDFKKDSIEVLEKNGWYYAENTTLWADNGIGMAMMMASASLDNHPDLELLFTVEEETWLWGALALNKKMLYWKKIINLDTEDEWEICISSAGWARVEIKGEYDVDEPTLDQYKIQIAWMKWGHSGVEIDQNRWNAIFLIAEFLSTVDLNYELVSIKGGVADNVIPSEAKFVVWLDYAWLFKSKLTDFVDKYKSEHDCPNLTFEMIETWTKEPVSPFYIVQPVKLIADWVYTMSDKIEWLVQTSVNLWTLNIARWSIKGVYLPRSSVESELEKTISDIEKCYKRYSISTKVKSRYPWWQDSPDSDLVKLISPIMKKILKKKPKILAYHAGLECGALVEKLGEWVHAVSIWPTIKGAHSVEEKCKISSVDKYWKILSLILK